MTYQNIKLSESEYQPVIEIKFSDVDKIILRELHSRLFLKSFKPYNITVHFLC